ncbi:MAG: ABC transporter ATP-binding protein [Candidatus Atribacteria bacterium]|nr:ABC transporter ATP-binding protein [Candidatus Atribacteria bacterium]
MLHVENLKVTVEDRLVLDGVTLEVREGEVHVLLGPNGVGKTTLLMAIMGVPGYRIVSGRLFFNGEDITNLDMEERAKKGIGIAFQKMPPVRGISLRTMGEIILRTHGVDDLSLLENAAHRLDCFYLLSREVGVGFSGGEAKRAEIFQLLLQRPLFSMVDEPESGVDLDNIALVGKALKELFEREQVRTKRRSGLVITHTGYILDYLNADQGHVLMNGRIVCSGNPRDLFEDIRTKGYNECLRCER